VLEVLGRSGARCRRRRRLGRGLGRRCPVGSGIEKGLLAPGVQDADDAVGSPSPA
jgi:hypothetical protein